MNLAKKLNQLLSIFVRSLFTTFGVDYDDKSALMNLNLCLAIKHHPIVLRKTGLMILIPDDDPFNDEIREGLPNTAIVSENIDGVRELTMQDSHVTYREIDTCLGISPTNIPYCMNTWP